MTSQTALSVETSAFTASLMQQKRPSKGTGAIVVSPDVLQQHCTLAALQTHRLPWAQPVLKTAFCPHRFFQQCSEFDQN
jgi:hypothetical protein